MTYTQIQKHLSNLGISDSEHGTAFGSSFISEKTTLSSFSPVDGNQIGTISCTSSESYDQIIQKAQEAHIQWRTIPAPKRGDIVREFGMALREKKQDLGILVAYEMGKSLQEGLGEVQEMIDICDFAVGLSRQLHGFTMHSERPQHRMYEQYHPLGIVGIISAFNFPVAVWAWNTALAWICGNVTIWKPSEKTPLCALACQKIIAQVLDNNNLPKAISCLLTGGAELGKLLANDTRVALVSATGSTRMGKSVATSVAARLGKSLLELGGNNAMIITPHANLQLALTGLVFGAVGTAGQRCTTTRRIIVHESILDDVVHKLTLAYQQLKIGSPLNEKNHMGPLIDTEAANHYISTLTEAKKQGATPIVEGKILTGKGYESRCYVSPAIYVAKNEFPIVQTETFAPLLYIIPYSGDVDNAIAIQNNVPQGLSSSIMSENLRETELFLSALGSDCGIANVNIGTSGAEIGGAFGGEKETGGGRESGSDAWKAYMRRQTNTINYSTELPLAQGIKFNI
ncbi:L-piperidine-6-carboxylate dehydrogenase [Aquimarina agarilytica]|uniref:L-piperidine-6-carboxylate dehydrogenase n=1 Tax=Aquimarina agarilytica TaxID=1087449 RepID=UPI000289B299|nr:aldehyde dehydrogenase family protein [Aquimarina agarilytica]